jgi:hypothetical protein
MDIRPITPSLAKILIEKSPLHAKAAMTAPFKPTKSMRLGTAVDALVFNGDRSDCTPGELKEAAPIAQVVVQEMRYLGIEQKQQATVAWQSDTGCPARGRWDILHGNEIIDLKTATDLSDYGIQLAIEKYGYDLQVAAYLEAVTVLKLVSEKPVGKLLFVETSAPYDVRMVTLDPLMVGSGMSRWLRACTTWLECHKTGNWPGRGSMTATPSRYRKAADGQEGFVDIPG